MKCEKIRKEVQKMIVMDIKVNNLYGFTNFHMNMSYPKKIVDSYIDGEFLKERPNFRYKKVNILMGANATGKTTIGKMLMMIFNFMDKKEGDQITNIVCDPQNSATFSMDFVVNDYNLYRIDTSIAAKTEDKYTSSDIFTSVRMVDIKPKDSYESCVKRLEKIPMNHGNSYIQELEKIKGLSWLFEYPADSQFGHLKIPKNSERYTQILENTLRSLDPSVEKVEKVDVVENTYVIRMKNQALVMQDGNVVESNILSSGTKAGIAVAGMLTSMIEGECSFYYCDEKFSYIHSEIEKAFLIIMIECLGENNQLFFTTHNTDILELALPKHSFTFLKKDLNDKDEPIKCISASKYLKRNTDSLKNAVDNDLFSTAPNIELIYQIIE